MQKKNCYIYTRVSTEMQVEGYSLEGQEERCRAMAQAKDYKVVKVYCDAGKSGASLDNRDEFNQMMQDIENHKDNVSMIFVFKLSRFGRNTRDVLNSFEILKDNNCNLCCVADSIDTTSDMGELMLKILAAIAELERQNIHTQTMLGRVRKAEKGLWNGGFSPYGYTLENGYLKIAEDEAEIIRIIFDRYVFSEMGYIGVAKYLLENGYEKKARQNGYLTTFTDEFVKKVLDNEVYMGKIHFGKRKATKTRNGKITGKPQKEYGVYDGVHEAIVSEELWYAAQRKRQETGLRQKKVHDTDHKFQLSGLIKCPLCGKGLVGNISRTKKKDGTYYPTRFNYRCNNKGVRTGHQCDFKAQPKENEVNAEVEELLVQIVSNPKFAEKMKEIVDTKTDSSEIDRAIERIEKQIRSVELKKNKKLNEQDSLDIDDVAYEEKYEDMQKMIEGYYEQIAELKKALQKKKEERAHIQQGKITKELAYKNLLMFAQLMSKCTDAEKQTLYNLIIKRIDIFEEQQPDKRWVKKVTFDLPLYVDKDIKNWRVEKETDETVTLLTRQTPEMRLELEIDTETFDFSSVKRKVTYKEIQKYIEVKTGQKIHSAYIAQVKEYYGLKTEENHRPSQKESYVAHKCTKEKWLLIEEALRHFGLIE